MKERAALVDGDIIVYQAGFASDTRFYVLYDLDEGDKEVARFEYKKDATEYMSAHPLSSLRMEKEVDHEPLHNALHTVDLMIDNIRNTTKCGNNLHIYLTGKSIPLLREDKDPAYKANRDPSHKPFWASEIYQYLIREYDATVTRGIEADDALGITQKQFLSLGYEPVICSLDKDLLTIPGEHYNWRKDSFYFISELEAQKNFWKQMLIGDAVDNIRGVPKIGKVKASRLIDHLEDVKMMEQAVMAAYYNAYGEEQWKDEFAHSYYLLYILRDDSELPDDLIWHEEYADETLIEDRDYDINAEVQIET